MKKTSMKKLDKIVQTLLEGEKVRGLHLSLLDIRELEYISYTLTHNKTATTINSNVKQVMEKCGFTLKTEGIGWKIS